MWQISDGTILKPSTNGTFFCLSDFRLRSHKVKSSMYPLLSDVSSIKYQKDNNPYFSKNAPKELYDEENYEVIKISDNYFKF